MCLDLQLECLTADAKAPSLGGHAAEVDVPPFQTRAKEALQNIKITFLLVFFLLKLYIEKNVFSTLHMPLDILGDIEIEKRS